MGRSQEDESKDRFFEQLGRLSQEMVTAHDKDFAMGALILAARWIAEGKVHQGGSAAVGEAAPH
ncbi:MAG: hypothetical protein KDK03_12605 [Rhodobacteraceae bacterium]|uniref:hypothetical protein n=1 Tax=Amaricoccus sp. B4 TaxID=3368557 RepID=UPI000DABC425|nr:hypothetical protein [Paracoccaceae bacterium]